MSIGLARRNRAARQRPGGLQHQKAEVAAFWDAASCGKIYATGTSEYERFQQQAATRYQLEPFIPQFARFTEGTGLDVLEVGVGLGADHIEWAKSNPRRLVGVDLTPRAIASTKARARLAGATTSLFVADAEHLALPDDSFDIVYSWGVLHHSPDTTAAIREVRRVLRPGGVARLMVYHRASLVGAVLWVRYGLMRFNPSLSLSRAYSTYLESPGTKAYSPRQVTKLLRRAGFSSVATRVELSSGDLMTGAAGQRHQGPLLRAARAVWPRHLISRFGRRLGLFLLIEAQ